MRLNDKFTYIHQSLVELTRNRGFTDLKREEKIKKVLQLCANILGVARVSVWNFNQERTAIRCELLFNADKDKFERNSLLARSDFPHYFNAIQEVRLIDACDAQNDPRTSEFKESYLAPLNITSMLDAPLFSQGEFSGVLCAEHVGEMRNWDVTELSFAASVADAISLVNEHDAWLAAHDRINYLAQFDSLTGLENRQYFLQRIERNLRGTNNRNCFRAILIYGIDDFKQFNDIHGATVADQVLCVLADRFQTLSSQLDCKVARLEGDSFGFWLPVLLSGPALNNAIKAVQSIAQQPVVLSQYNTVNLVGSLGVATDIHGSELNDPIRCAEIALQRAKEQARGTAVLFSESWLATLREEQDIENEVLHAFDDNQFVAFYQPIVCANTGVLKGIEALVRWQHPERGLMYPDKFLPLVTKLGLMSRLGNMMLEYACRDAKSLINQGIELQWVSVNVSSDQLYDTSLLANIESLLTRYQIPSQVLQLEIIEELICHDADIVRQQLDNIAALGIQLSIDDFGTGYSSLSRLKHLPVTKLKIDKTFVDGLPYSDDDQCIANSIIGLAKGMKIALVAEGVENQGQAKWLDDSGVDYLQGYLYAKPVPYNQLVEYIRAS